MIFSAATQPDPDRNPVALPPVIILFALREPDSRVEYTEVQLKRARCRVSGLNPTLPASSFLPLKVLYVHWAVGSGRRGESRMGFASLSSHLNAYGVVCLGAGRGASELQCWRLFDRKRPTQISRRTMVPRQWLGCPTTTRSLAALPERVPAGRRAICGERPGKTGEDEDRVTEASRGPALLFGNEPQ